MISCSGRNRLEVFRKNGDSISGGLFIRGGRMDGGGCGKSYGVAPCGGRHEVGKWGLKWYGTCDDESNSNLYCRVTIYVSAYE